MRAGRTWPLAAAAFVVLALAAPAAAHENGLGSSWLTEDHPGWYWPSTSSQSDNFEMVGSVERTVASSTYRNSDLAFWGRLAYAGHYEGFQIVDVGNPSKPKQLVDVKDCPGSQHDVSVWGGLLFVSVETPRTSPDCDSTAQPAGTPGFEGIRIFDVSNPRSPVLVKGVPTDCGSHTHTLVPDPRHHRVLLYVASYTAAELAPSSYGNECKRFDANGQPLHNKISVVEVPLRDPGKASVVSEPRFPQKEYRVGWYGCHDITVFMELEKAASACMGEGQIWDISDLEHPRTVGRVFNPNVEFFHSATFSYDGRRVIFGDEAGGGTGPALHLGRPGHARRAVVLRRQEHPQPRRGGRDAAQLVEGAAHPGEADAGPGAGPELHDAQLQHAADLTRRRAGLLGLCGRDHDGRLHEPLEAA